MSQSDDMDFMTSLFGGEPDGKPKGRRRLHQSQDENHSEMEVGDLPPEIEEGNVEYKLKLVAPSASRLQHLVTQLKWRLREGSGEAIYNIGVEDSGVCTGLEPPELGASIATLRKMAAELDASLTLLRTRDVGAYTDSKGRRRCRKVAEVLVRRVPESQEFIDLRVAVVGGADAGKSTLLGVLTSGELDDGRGKARLNLFRHLHEVQSGRTSSISLEVAGFDSDGNVVNYLEHSVEEICEKSTKLVTFIDLAGHQKFLRTTVFGLTGYKPHFGCLVVAANQGLVGTSREHLAITSALQISLFVVVTKVDVATPGQLRSTLRKLEELLKGPGLNKVPMRINTEDDAISAAQSIGDKTVGIFTVSSVSGDRLELLRTFLNVLPPSLSPRERQSSLQLPPQFHIDEIFHVPGVGAIAAGLQESGLLREGDAALVGPDADGGFHRVVVESLQRSKAPCRVVSAGQAASVALSEAPVPLRRGMVLLGADAAPFASRGFKADVFLLHHPTPHLCVGFQTTVHIGNVRQTATIVDIADASCLEKQTSVTVHFEFLRHPEYVPVGARLLFRQGKTKGIGQVTEICVEREAKGSLRNRAP